MNASGAKHGGARIIVESYCRWLEENDYDNDYIFIVGFKLITTSERIKVINYSTDGLPSVLFSTIGIVGLCALYRTNTVISFMNLNLILPFFNKTTYFHQSLFFTKKSLKFKIYGLLLKLQKNSTFICQNIDVKEGLSKYLGYHRGLKIFDAWPGIYIPNSTQKPKWFDDVIDANKIIALCPYSDIRMPYKNFEKLYEAYDFFKENNIQVIVTSKSYEYDSNDVFSFVSNCKSSEMHYLYQKVDCVLFISDYETVGLPIIESQYYGVPVVVRNVPFIKNIENRFPLLNLIVCNDFNFNFDISTLTNIQPKKDDICFIGEWNVVTNNIRK